jgi:hypothetical protein
MDDPRAPEDWFDRYGTTETFGREDCPPDPEAVRIRATPFRWRDPTTIPRRPWLYGVHLLRGMVSLTVAPGAVGKTSLLVGDALSLRAGPCWGRTFTPAGPSAPGSGTWKTPPTNWSVALPPPAFITGSRPPNWASACSWTVAGTKGFASGKRAATG